MDSTGEKDADKQNGTSCTETSSENLFESTGNRVTANSDGQYSSPDLLSENRGHKKCTNCFFKQILELLLSNCDSRVSSQCTEKVSGHRTMSRHRFSRMKTSLLSVPKLCVTMFRSLIDLFASRVSHQLPTYIAWMKAPHSVAMNAYSIAWNEEFYYAFPLFCLITQALNKIEKDKKNNFDDTMLADTVVLPPNIEHVDKETITISIISKTTNQSFRTDSSSCNKTNPCISGMADFRRHLPEKGVSVKAANLVSNSRRKISLSGYKSSWKT